MTTRLWVGEFSDEGNQYVAVGPDRDLLPVYKLERTLGGKSLEPLRMRYPACLRFMAPSFVSRRRRLSPGTIRRMFGTIPPPAGSP